MKRYLKDIIILLIQLFMFYVSPLFAGPTDAMGMVVVILIATFVLSLVLGIMSKEKIKIFYPWIIGELFIPSVAIYYNDSAYIHSIWYFVISGIGLLLGSIVNKLISKK